MTEPNSEKPQNYLEANGISEVEHDDGMYRYSATREAARQMALDVTKEIAPINVRSVEQTFKRDKDRTIDDLRLNSGQTSYSEDPADDEGNIDFMFYVRNEIQKDVDQLRSAIEKVTGQK